MALARCEAARACDLSLGLRRFENPDVSQVSRLRGGELRLKLGQGRRFHEGYGHPWVRLAEYFCLAHRLPRYGLAFGIAAFASQSPGLLE